MTEIRCRKCNKLLARAEKVEKLQILCPRCRQLQTFSLAIANIVKDNGHVVA